MNGKVDVYGFVDLYLFEDFVVVVLNFGIVLMHDIPEVFNRKLLENVFIVFVDIENVPIN